MVFPDLQLSAFQQSGMGSALQGPRNVFCPDTTPHGPQRRLRRNLAHDLIWKTSDVTAEEAKEAHLKLARCVRIHFEDVFDHDTVRVHGSFGLQVSCAMRTIKEMWRNLPKRTRVASHDAAGEDGTHVPRGTWPVQVVPQTQEIQLSLDG